MKKTFTGALKGRLAARKYGDIHDFVVWYIGDHLFALNIKDSFTYV